RVVGVEPEVLDEVGERRRREVRAVQHAIKGTTPAARPAPSPDDGLPSGLTARRSQPSCRRKRHALRPTSTTVNRSSDRSWGYTTSSPTPLIRTPRVIAAKWRTGLRSVRG